MVNVVVLRVGQSSVTKSSAFKAVLHLFVGVIFGVVLVYFL